MLFLSYDRPVTPENFPTLAAGFALLKTRIRRRKLISPVCGTLCFLLHTSLMILSSVGLFYRLSGDKYRAALDSLPHVAEVLNFCFHTLPERIGLQMETPELLGLAGTLILPPLLCMVLALLLRICLRLFGKKEAPAPDPQTLLADARAVAAVSKSRKANWIMLSGFLSMAAFAGAVLYSLLIVRPVSSDWDFKYFLSYIFIALVIFSVFQLVATLTDSFLEFFCGLDYQWDGGRLIEDLEACLAREESKPGE